MIISIVRNTHGIKEIPNEFTVGENVIVNGEVVKGLVVKDIKFWETGHNKGQNYRGKCYVVSFVDSDVKRIIPAEPENIIEIAVETITKKAELNLPE